MFIYFLFWQVQLTSAEDNEFAKVLLILTDDNKVPVWLYSYASVICILNY